MTCHDALEGYVTVTRISAGQGPSGQLFVAGVDADQLAVLRANIDSALVNNRRKTNRRADIERAHGLSALRIHLEHLPRLAVEMSGTYHRAVQRASRNAGRQ